MGEKKRSTWKTLTKNKKRKGTHLKKTIRDEKRPLNSKIDSDDVNEEHVPEEEESQKKESKLPENFEEDERNLESAAADDDGENSERRPKKKRKKMMKFCCIKDKSYYDWLLAKYPRTTEKKDVSASEDTKILIKRMSCGPYPIHSGRIPSSSRAKVVKKCSFKDRSIIWT